MRMRGMLIVALMFGFLVSGCAGTRAGSGPSEDMRAAVTDLATSFHDLIINKMEDMADAGVQVDAEIQIDAAQMEDMTPIVSVGMVQKQSLVVPTFTVSSLMTGQEPAGIATGDWNGDRVFDLMVTNFTDGTYGLYAGNGKGGFKFIRADQVGGQPVRVVAGDWNGDGKLDCALTNWSTNKLQIIFGNGNGTFQAPISYPTGMNPDGLAVGDWNGDKVLDLVITNRNSRTTSIFIGKGDGSFEKGVDYVTGFNPDNPRTGDWDGDKKLDIIVVDDTGGQLLLLPGKGDGTFGVVSALNGGPAPEGLMGGDLNGDGRLDLAIGNFGKPGMPGSVSVLLNGAMVPVSVGVGELRTNDIVVADWNGDRRPDLVAINETSDSASFFLGNGDGTFEAGGVVAAAGTTVAVVGDWNGDNKPDLAVTNSALNVIRVLLNTTP